VDILSIPFRYIISNETFGLYFSLAILIVPVIFLYLSEKLDNKHRFLLVVLAAALPLIGVSVLVLPIVLVLISGILPVLFETLFKEEYFFHALIIIFLIWLYLKRVNDSALNSFEKALTPWLVGMGVVGILSISAEHVIPRLYWKWLFKFEDLTIAFKELLGFFVPDSLTTKILVVLMIFIIDITLPHLPTWTISINRILTNTKNLSKILAVIVSFTLFGAGQTNAVARNIESEKYTRIEPDANALASLTLQAKLIYQKEIEKEIAKNWLQAIAQGVYVEMQVSKKEYGEIHSKNDVDRLIDDRAKELTELLNKELRSIDVGGRSVATTLEFHFGKRITDSQRLSAKNADEKTLKEFASEVAKTSSNSMWKITSNSDALLIAQKLISDLYKVEVIRLAQKLV